MHKVFASYTRHVQVESTTVQHSVVCLNTSVDFDVSVLGEKILVNSAADMQ